LDLVLILFLKKAPEFQSEKQNESEGKRKSAITCVTALFFLVERSIDPPRRTNLDDITDMSRRSLIYVGLEQIESIN
jgi:hypothetical protein